MLEETPKNRPGKLRKPSVTRSGTNTPPTGSGSSGNDAGQPGTPYFPSILGPTEPAPVVPAQTSAPTASRPEPAAARAVSSPPLAAEVQSATTAARTAAAAEQPRPIETIPSPAPDRNLPAVGQPPPAAPQQSPAAVQTESRWPGRDLPVAIGVGVGLGVAIIASLVIYRPAFLGIVAAAVLISVWELTRALRSARVRAPLVPLMLGSLAMIAVTWLSGPSGLAVTAMLTVLAALVWRLSDGPVGYFRDASTAVLITLYVPLLACFAVLMLRPDDGTTRIVAFILTVVCSDVGGYGAGSFFGKHPMSPTVSPKKSWEGFAGSVLACMVAGMLLVGIALDGIWWQGIVYGAAIATTATLGDLGESIIKRDLGIKDMGTLLPGHGGLMDRMDSLLPSAAVAYLLLTLFVGAA